MAQQRLVVCTCVPDNPVLVSLLELPRVRLHMVGIRQSGQKHCVTWGHFRGRELDRSLPPRFGVVTCSKFLH